MKCCCTFFLVFITFAFVQIRLRQQRDSLNFPVKFSQQFKLVGDATNAMGSTILNITHKKIYHGDHTITVVDKNVESTLPFVADLYIRIKGPPMSFHTVEFTENLYVTTSTTVMLNTEGVGLCYLKNPIAKSLMVTHRFDSGGAVDPTQNNVASATGILHLQNIIYVDSGIDSKWEPL